MKAMQESVLKLKTIPEYIIVDGNRPLNGKLGMKQKEGKIFNAKEIEILSSIPNTSTIKPPLVLHLTKPVTISPVSFAEITLSQDLIVRAFLCDNTN